MSVVRFNDLARYRTRIERAVSESYLRARPSPPLAVGRFTDLGRDLTLRGGKRFRALLLLAGYSIATGRRPVAALEAAAALEHFQSWMLVHDDVIDHSAERRGGRTVHLAAGDLHRKRRLSGSSEQFGTGIAITLGDLEEPFVIEGLLRSHVPTGRKLAALREYGRMTRLTAFGQLLDILNGARDPGEVTEQEVLQVHELKSAEYTVVSPLRIGAILGGASAPLRRALSGFGRDLGIAFQLRDDVLGAGFGAEQSGKSSNDLSEGKRTLLVVWAWRKGTSAQRAALARALGNPSATHAELEGARAALRATGSLAHSEEMIHRLSTRGLRRVERSRSIRNDAKPLLRDIAARLVERVS